MREFLQHKPVIYVLMTVLVILMASVNCTLGSLVSEAPTPTLTATATTVPTATIQPTPTITPIPGIEAPLAIGPINLLLYKASFQDSYELDIQEIRAGLEEESSLVVTDAKMKINGMFSQPDGPGGSLFEPMESADSFLVVYAKAEPTDCDSIMGWTIQYGDQNSADDISGLIMTCWEMENPEDSTSELRIIWAFLVHGETNTLSLLFPEGQAIDLASIME